MDQSRNRLSAASPPSAQRTRIANGSAILLGAKDERSLFVRRLKEIIAEFVDDMGGTGDLTAAQRSLIRRAAVLTVQLEQMETRFAEDPTVGERTLDLYGRTSGNLRRLLETLGIKRREPPTKTLKGFLAERTGR